jgi:hypothetical protein
MAGRRRISPPEKRARKQLRAVRQETLKAVKALGKSYPNIAKSDEILRAHQHRVKQIVGQERAQPNRQEVCSICWKPLMQPAELWTDSLPLKFLYALAIACLFGLFGWLFEWRALLIFPIGWAMSQSFLWTISVPLLMLLTFVLFMSLFGL